MTPDIVLPKRARKIILAVAGVLSLALGAAPKAFAALHMSDPSWFNAISDVFGFIVAAPLFLALVNVNKDAPALDVAPRRAADTSDADVAPVDSSEVVEDAPAETDADDPAALPVDDEQIVESDFVAGS